MSLLHSTSTPKLCSDTSTSSDCFNKQESLDEDVGGEILHILDDFFSISEGFESTSQGYTTSESRLTGYFGYKTFSI